MSVEHTDEPLTAVEVTHSPATVSSILATGAAVLAVLASATSLLAMVVAAFGLLGVAGGLFVLDSKRATALGTGVVFVGVVLSGVFGSGTTPMLVFGSLATILSFDFGQNAFSVGDQLSDDTETTRGELVHAAASVAVGIIVVGLAYGVYLVGIDGLSVGSLTFLLLGAVLLLWAIRT